MFHYRPGSWQLSQVVEHCWFPWRQTTATSGGRQLWNVHIVTTHLSVIWFCILPLQTTHIDIEHREACCLLSTAVCSPRCQWQRRCTTGQAEKMLTICVLRTLSIVSSQEWQKRHLDVGSPLVDGWCRLGVPGCVRAMSRLSICGQRVEDVGLRWYSWLGSGPFAKTSV